MANFRYLDSLQVTTCGKYPFSMGQFRNLLLYRHKNGLEDAVRKVGKRILIREDLFDLWLESKAKGDNHE